MLDDKGRSFCLVFLAITSYMLSAQSLSAKAAVHLLNAQPSWTIKLAPMNGHKNDGTARIFIVRADSPSKELLATVEITLNGVFIPELRLSAAIFAGPCKSTMSDAPMADLEPVVGGSSQSFLGGIGQGWPVPHGERAAVAVLEPSTSRKPEACGSWAP